MIKSITGNESFGLGGRKFDMCDLTTKGFNVADENRLVATKHDACLKLSYTAEDFAEPDLKLEDRQTVYFRGDRWMVVVVDPKLNASDCVRFIKL